MVQWLQQLYSSEGIAGIIQAGGLVALIAVVFSETGLLLGFFLPGDSLLITAGVISNPGHPMHVPALQIATMNVALVLAAVAGDQTGFYLGRRTGNAVWSRPDGRFYKRKHLEAAHAFYERWGGWAVVGARFVPILRTFVPFAAGMSRMAYRKFVLWNILGGVTWITTMLWAGYFLGQTPWANRLDKLIVLVVFVSVLPILIGAVRRWLRNRSVAQARTP
ncbi:MAG TPA: VTT domain-containing protein [Myxococcales bacterium]|nr:VTT domain-containing protein [Myxococcales bacterium]